MTINDPRAQYPFGAPLPHAPEVSVNIDSAVNDALELAAQTLETTHANSLYRQAWRKAAKMVRSLKRN